MGADWVCKRCLDWDAGYNGVVRKGGTAGVRPLRRNIKYELAEV